MADNEQLWCVWIEDESGTQECVAEGFRTEEAAKRYAAEVESRESFWAEARKQA